MNQIDNNDGSITRCLAPEIGEKVYDYYNGALDEAGVREFEQHLVRCVHCESVVVQLDQMMMVLQDEESFELPSESESRESSSSPASKLA